MKTFIIHYIGGNESIAAYGEWEARANFKRILPGKTILYITF